MDEEFDWRPQVRRRSAEHEAALEAADVVFEDVVLANRDL